METEQISMQIIAFSGNARTLAFEALEEYKSKNYEKCDELLKEAVEALNEAHKSQTSLLVAEANGQDPKCNVLLIHAQDHLMTSMLALDLIRQMIDLHRMESEDR